MAPGDGGGSASASAPSVLVVEDDEDVARLLRSHLQRLGWVVRWVATAEEGLQAAVEAPPQLVVVDLVLPGMDGRELVRRLRADGATSGCRIVVTSVLDRDEQLELTPDAVLPKPFSRQDAVDVLAPLWPAA
jgi:CheY-like chemotaxis protein